MATRAADEDELMDCSLRFKRNNVLSIRPWKIGTPSSTGTGTVAALEAIEKCMELGVPIFQGRIDKTLFLLNLSEQSVSSASSAARVATA